MMISKFSEVKVSSLSQYRPEIDGLRAFAVVAVIINHFNKNILPGGYLGVDIFFVISGYVITSSLFKRQSRDFKDFLGGFYERRIKRLVPALSIFVLVTAIVICLFDPDPGLSLRTGIASLFGLSNLYLFRQSTDYFSQASEMNVFTHTWSLGVEEQFYILFPFLIWFSGFAKQARNGSRNLFFIIGTLTIASFIGFVCFYSVNQAAAYFLMPMRFWEMAAGCLTFIGLQKKSLVKQFLEIASPLLVFACICLVMFLPISWAVVSTTMVVILTSILIACLKETTTVYKTLTHPKIIYLGLISYSLYLWHWSVLSISRWTIGIHWWSVPFQFALMFALAMASYQWIETPLRRNRWFRQRWKTISAGGFLLFFLSFGLAIFSKSAKGKLYTGKMVKTEQLGVSTLITPYAIKGDVGAWSGESCILSSNDQINKTIMLEGCTLGNFKSAKRRVLVIGNSFSAAFVQAFDDLVKNHGFSVTITSSWGASPIPDIDNNTPWDKVNNYYWKTVIPQLAGELVDGDVILAMNDLSNFSPAKSDITSESSSRLEVLAKGITKFANQMSNKGIKLIFLNGLPFAREANCKPNDVIPQWFQPFKNQLEICKIPDRKESLERRSPLAGLLVNLKRDGVIDVIDLFDIFCPSTDCNYFGMNNTLLYRDEFSHPSVEAARLSSRLIKEKLLLYKKNDHK